MQPLWCRWQGCSTPTVPFAMGTCHSAAACPSEATFRLVQVAVPDPPTSAPAFRAWLTPLACRPFRKTHPCCALGDLFRLSRPSATGGIGCLLACVIAGVCIALCRVQPHVELASCYLCAAMGVGVALCSDQPQVGLAAYERVRPRGRKTKQLPAGATPALQPELPSAAGR